ncbi:MAG: HAMP domain-containing sensor histidine kinase [Pseudomonadota bacterium]
MMQAATNNPPIDRYTLDLAKLQALSNNAVASSLSNVLGGLMAFWVVSVTVGGSLPYVTLGLHCAAAAIEFVGSSFIGSQLKRPPLSARHLHRLRLQMIAQRAFIAFGWGAYGWLYFDPSDVAQSMLITAVVLTFSVSASGFGAYLRIILVNGRLITIGPLILSVIVTPPDQALIFVIVCVFGIILGLTIGRNVDRAFEAALSDRIRSEKAQADLKRALNFGTSMIDTVEHDLQQPLKAMELYAYEMLNPDAKIDADQAGRLRTGLQHSADNVRQLITQLMDAQRARRAELKPTLRGVSVNEIFSNLAMDFEFTAKSLGVEINFVPCSDVIHTDPEFAARALRNLIQNALKHGLRRDGGPERVLVGCRRGATHTAIQVIDRGRGFAQAPQEALGDKTAAQEDHAGLGLFIVRRFTEAVDAEVDLWTRAGRGTIFTIRFPRHVDDCAPQT